MEYVELVAQRHFRYATKALVAGEQFNAKARDARVLVATGRAKLFGRPIAAEPEEISQAEVERDATHEDVVEKKSKKSGRKRR